MRTAEISVKNILQDGNACKSPTVTFDETPDSCLLINCIDNETIIVQIPDDCEEKCITFTIDCDDCDTCPPQRITRCLCDSLDECPNCEECIGGFCEPIICSGDNMCDPATGDCVQCITDANCDCDQECVNGICQCEPGQLINPQGCCVDCLNNDQCPECSQCIGGACVEVVCPDGICDPTTDRCVECIEDEICGVNECCVNNRCACCPGYYLDAEGDCVEIPDCVTNTDCPACYRCLNGECVPIVCPDGRTCVDGECVLACDCSNPNCPSGQVCITGPSGACFCSPCSGICENNGDCGEGCGCYDGACAPLPCFGACFTGADCGEGCGCLNGECVDCSTLTCAQCAFVLGCDCIGGECSDSGCSKPCANGDDCDTGCGCSGNNCVACESVSCVTNANCPQGCYCNGGTCSANPCAELYCSSPEDCGQGCTCVNGLCVPCSSLSCLTQQCANTVGCECVNGSCEDDNEDCTDELTLEKADDACDLIGELTTDGCCQCDFITATVNVDITETGTDEIFEYDFTIDLKKDGVLLGSTGVTNELPTSGIFRVRVIDNMREVNDSQIDSPFKIGASTTTTEDIFINMAGVDTNTGSGNFRSNRLPRFIGGKWYRVTNRRIEVSVSTTLLFPNLCRYTLATQIYNIAAGTIPPATTPEQTYTLTRLVNCRLPLFTFYRDTDAVGINSEANIIEQVYAAEISDGVYQHTLTSYPDLQYGRYYGLSTDCGCAEDTVYSCYGTQVPTPLVFCDPESFLYEITDCGKTIVFTDDVTITCDVYTAVGAPKPQYQLLLNGVVVATITLGTAPSVGNVLFAEDDEFTSTTVINTIELRIVGDVCDECTIMYQELYAGLEVTLDVTSNCSAEEDASATFTITGGSPTYDYDILRNGVSVATGTVPTANLYTIFIPNVPGNYTINITDDDACVATANAVLTTPIISGQISITSTCIGSQGYVTVQNNSVYNATISISTVGNSSVGAGGTSSIPVNTGSYTVTVTPTGAEGCAVVETIEVNCCVGSLVNNVGVSYSCANGLQYTGLIGGYTTTIRNNSNVVVTTGTGNSLPAGNYNITISDGFCSIIRPLTVQQCYECVASVCEAASPNLGSTLAVCESTCGACDTCDFISLFISGRLFSVRINGVDYPLGANVGATCLSNNITIVGTLVSTLTNLLLAQGDCGSPSITVTSRGFDVDLDPNECLPASGCWAEIVIANSGLDIEGGVVDGGCFVPALLLCDPV